MTPLGLSLRFGSDCPLQVVMFQPLFEEYNRCRRLLCGVGRRLEHEGIGIVLADLSAMGESLSPIGDVSLALWRDEAARVVEAVAPVVVASMRGGALLDDAGDSTNRWRFAPEGGARIVRDLRRAALTGEIGLYAGHALGTAFLAELEAASARTPARLRTVQLESDVQSADAKLHGSPLWRRAEPGEDDVMAAAMADDLASWTRLCAAC